MNQELLEHILEVSRQLAETRTLIPLLERIMVEALHLVGAERGYIVLMQIDGTLDFRVARHYNGTPVLDADDQVSRSVLIQTIEKRQPLLLRDAMNEAYFNQQNSVTFLKLRSVMCVPLITRGKAIGAIYVENRAVRGRFREEDLPPLVIFSNQAAVTIENVTLNEDLEARIAERTRELEDERALLTQRVAERTLALSAANAELVHAAHLKDEFLATVSHELRTPLTAILNLTEALQLKIYGELSPKQEKALQSIHKSGYHLLALINDVLDLAKIEAGALELAINLVFVKTTCQASLELVQEHATKKRIQLLFEYDDTVTTMMTDERRLKQILVNLLDNAIKFTPEDGQVGLKIVGEAAADRVCFIVWDNGIGISPEEQRLIFQPFVQLDSSLTRKNSGTGLGLAIIKRIVDTQGGEISLESKLDQGSRFMVGLPWHKTLSLPL
ncbi:MAG: ATP-binding protein [Chloroflexi bacterium]|nr:ATP-binding protein [Chloroflexota bacterium]